MRMPRRLMSTHTTNCPYRKVNCKNHGCELEIVFKDKMVHEGECLFSQVECKNNCGKIVRRKHIQEHYDECKFQLLQCPYYDYGCKLSIQRNQYEDHLKEEAFRHSILFIEGQKAKNKEVEELRKEVSRLKKDYETEIK